MARPLTDTSNTDGHAGAFSLHDVDIHIPWSVLSHFKIETSLQTKQISLVQTTEVIDSVKFTCDKYSKAEVRDFFQTFVKNICMICVNFRSNSTDKLLFINGEVNDNVLIYLQNLCKDGFCVYFCAKTRHCYIYGKNMTELAQIENMLAQSIVEIVLTAGELQQIHKYIQKWNGSKKLIECKKSDYATVYIATRDVQNYLEENAVYDHFVKISILESELFSKCEESKMSFMDKHAVTVVNCNEQTGMLQIKGSKKSLCTLMSDIKEMFVQTEETFTVLRSQVHSVEDNLQKVAHENKCSMSIHVNVPEKHDVGGKRIVSWLNLDGQGVHLVQGDLLKLKVDVTLLLTTTAPFPLSDLSESFIEKLIELVKRSDSTRNLSHGQPWLSKPTAPTLCLLPVLVSSPSKETVVDTERILQDAFSQFTAKRFESVAIHASVFDAQVRFVPDFLKHFVKASALHRDLQFYICCTSNEDVSSIANTIHEYHLVEKQAMVLRHIHADNVILRGFRPTEIEVTNGSLPEQKVDALVNTVNRKLNLSKGVISAMLLNRAGQIIQDECNAKHQNGLAEGDYVVTSAGLLEKSAGIKHIIHCVLPKFQKIDFDKTIKCMVKLCLLEADRHKCKSIAIPPIGTGRMNYPARETAYAMLTAAKEYQTEAVCSTLEQIVFVVFENANGMLKQFYDVKNDVLSGEHEVHRGLANCEIPGVKKQYGSKEDHVKIHVTAKPELKYLSKNTAVFEITPEKGVHLSHGPGLKMPTQFNGISEALAACRAAHVTEIALVLDIQTSELCKEYCDSVATAISTIVSYQYLRHVYIAVQCQIFHQTKGLLTNRTMAQRLTSFMRDTWIETDDKEVTLSVKMSRRTGLKDGTVMKLLTEFKQSVCDGRCSCSTIANDLDHDAVVVEFSDLNEVSANINQGMIKYLQERDDIEKWKSAVEKAFNVHFSWKNVGLTVGGDMQAIVSFETYLYSDFPKYPSNSSLKTNVRSPSSMESSEYMGAAGNKSVFKSITSFDFDEMAVSVCLGDIADSTEDCIISPTHMYIIKTYGVAKRLLEKGGDKYKVACKILEEDGKLYPSECRISDAGDLQCKKVIHVGIPHFDEVNNENLKLLEVAVLNCLETAGAYGIETVAMPAVGTGSGALTLEHSAQQISRALIRYKKNNRYVGHVNIVILDENKAMKFNIADNANNGMPGPKISINKPLVAFGNKIRVLFPPFTRDTNIKLDAIVVNSRTGIENPLVTNTVQFPDKIDNFNSEYVVQTSLPVWNPKAYPNITYFEKKIQCQTESLMNVFDEHKWSAVALPLFGESGKPELFQSPLLRASFAMIRGLEHVKQCKNIGILELYVVSSNMDFVEMFYDLLNHETCFKRYNAN